MFNIIEFTREFGDYLGYIFPNVPANILRYIEYLPLFIIGFAIALILTPLLGKLAYKLGITYKPKEQKRGREFDNPDKAVHDVETPSLGGITVSIPILLFILFVFGINSTTIPILLGLIIIIVLSIADDILVLPSYPQLVGVLLAASVIAISSIDLTFINIPFITTLNLDLYTFKGAIGDLLISIVFPGDLILIAWISVCVITLKVVGGSPGLVESNSFIAYLLIFVISIRVMNELVIFSSIFTAGLILGLLVFAFPPQKIFSGSSGKLFYGFLIAVFAILNSSKFASTLLILLLPIIDFSIVVIKRMIKTRDINIIRIMRINGREHFHHHLLALGLDPKTILLIETSIAIIMASIAVLTTGAVVFFIVLIISLVMIIGILVLGNIANIQLKKKSQEIDSQSPESKYSY